MQSPQDALQPLEALECSEDIHIRMMDGLDTDKAAPQTIMIDVTYLKAHRTASSLRLKTGRQAVWLGAPKAE